VLKDKNAKVMSEFFVLKKYRRAGIGKYAARTIFDMFPGPWEILQHKQNRISILFWDSIVKKHSEGRYQVGEIDTKDGPRRFLTFDNSRG
jgi:predicted acetyltransferase